MSALVRLELKPGLGRHLKAGHPWVFKRGLEHVPKLPAGSVVDLTEGSRFVARGYYDPLSAIAVRVLTRNPNETIDAAFFARAIKGCWDARQQLIDFSKGDTDAFRVVHGEGDGLPGVVVDLYAGFAVLKLYSAGLTPYRPLIVEGLKAAIPGLKGIVGRDEVVRDDEGEDGRGTGKVLWGAEAPQPLTITERGAKFLVDVYQGQKTGFFLDQREHRLSLGRVSQDARVLNVFGYTGGFSIHAGLGGASEVATLDISTAALDQCDRDWAANGLDPADHTRMEGDAFELMRELEPEAWDRVIVDPPAFAKARKDIEKAFKAYKDVFRLGARATTPGGLLWCFSCSQHLDRIRFQEAVWTALLEANREGQVLAHLGQPMDHPYGLNHPEGFYLKGLLVRVV